VCGEYAYGWSRCHEHIRFIPTCVGNTSTVVADRTRPPVHPHVCGEYLRQHRQYRPLCRFIPTCVGNTPYIH